MIVPECPTLRQCRIALALSQAAFADRLGVSAETDRTWDSGRRPPPGDILKRARVLARYPDQSEPLPLSALAAAIGVHLKTLQAAARDGRLAVVYDSRTTFRRLRTRSTLAAAHAFRRHRYGHRPRVDERPTPLRWSDVPDEYDAQIRALRQRLNLSQRQFAALIGAARKAVVYQWESRRRCPSPVFWSRIAQL
jgi:DNA-binding transcriptional regulator YiaG